MRKPKKGRDRKSEGCSAVGDVVVISLIIFFAVISAASPGNSRAKDHLLLMESGGAAGTKGALGVAIST